MVNLKSMNKKKKGIKCKLDPFFLNHLVMGDYTIGYD